MGMPAGITDVPGYRKYVRCLSMTIPFHEISFIVSESTQAAFGGTVRTLLTGLQSRLNGRFKPLPIRKFHLIELAKNREQTYHKYAGTLTVFRDGTHKWRGSRSLAGRGFLFFSYRTMIRHSERYAREKRAVFRSTLSELSFLH